MRLGNIELLRCFAALGVVFFHSVGGLLARGYDVSILKFFYATGSLGVDVFFVISGFVIYRGVLTSRRRPWEFMRNRLKRILPSYWILTLGAAVFTLTLIKFGLQGSLRQPDFKWGLESLTFTSGFFGNGSPILYQGWSLEYEFLFYLVMSLGLLIPNKYVAGLVPAAGLTTLVFVSGLSGRILEFVGGMAVALLANGLKSNRLLGTIFVTCGIGLLCANSWAQPDSGLTDFLLGLGANSLVFGLILLPQLKSKLVEKLGSASYPVYLIQWFTIPLAFAAMSKFSGHDLSAALISLVVALVATQFAGMAFDAAVDKPIHRYFTRKSI